MAWTKKLGNELWLGQVEEDEKNKPPYGVWPLGDQPQCFQTPKLRYKSWFGHPEKYRSPGHQVPTGAHDGRHEFVMVMHGCLACTVEGRTNYLNYPNSVDLPPTLPRTWTLPDTHDSAEGITICRFNPLWASGGGQDYHLRLLDSHQGGILTAIEPYPGTIPWTHCYIEVFSGSLVLDTKEIISEEIWAEQYACVSSSLLPQNLIVPRSVRGVALYF
jgi:hypothetical protein